MPVSTRLEVGASVWQDAWHRAGWRLACTCADIANQGTAVNKCLQMAHAPRSRALSHGGWGLARGPPPLVPAPLQAGSGHGGSNSALLRPLHVLRTGLGCPQTGTHRRPTEEGLINAEPACTPVGVNRVMAVRVNGMPPMATTRLHT